MNHRTRTHRVLSIFPANRGFGYAVFEDLLSPVDWGVKHIRGEKHDGALRKVRALIDWYQPTVLVLENCAGAGSRKGKRIQELLEAIARIARRRNIVVKRFSRTGIRQCFGRFGARTKHEIARAIARHLPELEPRLPPPRKIWMSEDSRMSIFDAVSLIFTFFCFEEMRGIDT
jgi:hypothetical protein